MFPRYKNIFLDANFLKAIVLPIHCIFGIVVSEFFCKLVCDGLFLFVIQLETYFFEVNFMKSNVTRRYLRRNLCWSPKIFYGLWKLIEPGLESTGQFLFSWKVIIFEE